MCSGLFVVLSIVLSVVCCMCFMLGCVGCGSRWCSICSIGRCVSSRLLNLCVLCLRFGLKSVW